MRVNAYSCLLFAAAVTPALCSNNNATAKPNLIILVADDLGHNDVGWANPRTITPNLDNVSKLLAGVPNVPYVCLLVELGGGDRGLAISLTERFKATLLS